MGAILLTSAYYRTNSASLMAESANRFLASLTAEQRAKATFPLDDPERFKWFYVPIERKGLPLREMSPYQKHLASALLSAGLSQTGYIKAVTIMSLEDVLREMEKDSGERRNPEKYYFSIFGTPSDTGTGAYRVEGHHVSQNYTVSNGHVVDAPSFFGAQSGGGSRGTACRAARAGRRGRPGPRSDRVARCGAEEDGDHRCESLSRYLDDEQPQGCVGRRALGTVCREDDGEAVRALDGVDAGVRAQSARAGGGSARRADQESGPEYLFRLGGRGEARRSALLSDSDAEHS